MSGVLFVGRRRGFREVLLLPAEPLTEAKLDALVYAEENVEHAIVLEPVHAFDAVIERQVSGLRVGGDGAVAYFEPAVVRGVVRREASGRFVMIVESGTVCERGTYRLWDFVVSSLPTR